jgi:hypothetical protein
MKVMNPATWNAVFWILLVFSAITAIGRSFIQDSRGKNLYMYTLASPHHYILSKMFYNALLMIVVAFLPIQYYYIVLIWLTIELINSHDFKNTTRYLVFLGIPMGLKMYFYKK